MLTEQDIVDGLTEEHRKKYKNRPSDRVPKRVFQWLRDIGHNVTRHTKFTKVADLIIEDAAPSFAKWFKTEDKIHNGSLTNRAKKELVRALNDRIWELKAYENTKNGRSVYFIGNEELGIVKIGISNDVERRLSDIQVSFPYDLKILAVLENKTTQLEKYLHDKFEKYNKRGEWYELSKEIKEYID